MIDKQAMIADPARFLSDEHSSLPETAPFELTRGGKHRIIIGTF